MPESNWSAISVSIVTRWTGRVPAGAVNPAVVSRIEAIMRAARTDSALFPLVKR